jgi:hypothetical protein
MRRTRVRGMKATSAELTKIGGSAASRWAWIIAALINGVLFEAAGSGRRRDSAAAQFAIGL